MSVEEPVAPLQGFKLLCLDAVEGAAGDSSADGRLSHAAHKQVNVVGMPVEGGQSPPFVPSDVLGWDSPIAGSREATEGSVGE